MPTVVARKREIAVLEQLCNTTDPQFLAVYGRRRIGKTFLISQYFADKGRYFELTGSDKFTQSAQLATFVAALTGSFPDAEQHPMPADWLEAFHQLRVEIEKRPTTEKIILFFDELPWLASRNSNFLAALEFFWNRYMSRRNNIIIVICGSAAAWMIKHIISDKGGLYGRLTKKIHLQPFNLAETEEFLQSRHIHLARKDIVELYMSVGGVAKYLTYVERGKLTTQTINDLYFRGTGDLYNEFDSLYRSLFSNYKQHIKVIRTLADARSGMQKNQLLSKSGLSSGGTSSSVIRELVESDFLLYSLPFGDHKTSGYYQLIDEYSLFYLRWLESQAEQGKTRLDPDYWTKQKNTPRFASWAGLAFEAVCQKHIVQIKKALGIAAVTTTASSWQYQSTGAKAGAQIDLVIDRADHCINLCEMKFYAGEFTIDRAYADKLAYKKQLFREQTVSRKTLFSTMITSHGVKENDHYLSVVDGGQITIDDLFEPID